MSKTLSGCIDRNILHPFTKIWSYSGKKFILIILCSSLLYDWSVDFNILVDFAEKWWKALLCCNFCFYCE